MPPDPPSKPVLTHTLSCTMQCLALPFHFSLLRAWDFESLENVEKSSYVLGSELWESKFDGLLGLVKEYIVDVWEIQKHN